VRPLLQPFVLAGEIAWYAPQVIAKRAVRLVRDGRSPRSRRELRRMVGEKAVGFTQSALAVPAATAGVATAVLTPIHRRVKANHRRLG
jgi:hypothetical protein